VVSGQWAVGSGQGSVLSAQGSGVGGRWSVVGGRLAGAGVWVGGWGVAGEFLMPRKKNGWMREFDLPGWSNAVFCSERWVGCPG